MPSIQYIFYYFDFKDSMIFIFIYVQVHSVGIFLVNSSSQC